MASAVARIVLLYTCDAPFFDSTRHCGASRLQTDWEALIEARAEADGQLRYGWLMKSHNRKGGPAHKSLHPKWLAGVSPCHTSVGTKTYLPIALVECNAHGTLGGLWLTPAWALQLQGQ
jgi:hypothetical protein